ncbi:MAG TPA: hypothetical protein VFQ61_14420, partial [Polyangiaceae bacterium]|nr:hypothetical protein [Polyangiaceae bacterium]
MEGPILSHTRRIADQLAQEFRGNPERELEIWATTAQQREAMVVELYDAAAIENRFPKRAGEPEVSSVVRKAIGGIWAQERSHTTLVESLRIVDEARLTALRSMLGAMEGRVTHTATAPSWTRSIASFLVGLGRTAGHAPEFTSGFRSLSLREFFRFSQELETTAKEGYERIVELLDRLVPNDALAAIDSRQKAGAIKLGITAPYEFAKTLAEECFHAAVFERLEAWLEPDGHSFEPLSAHDAVLQLRALAVEHLS